MTTPLPFTWPYFYWRRHDSGRSSRHRIGGLSLGAPPFLQRGTAHRPRDSAGSRQLAQCGRFLRHRVHRLLLQGPCRGAGAALFNRGSVRSVHGHPQALYTFYLVARAFEDTGGLR